MPQRRITFWAAARFQLRLADGTRQKKRQPALQSATGPRRPDHQGHRFRRRPEDQVPRRPCPVARSGPDPVSFFHLNKYSADPVILHAVEGGKAREILYGPDYFDYGASGLDAQGAGQPWLCRLPGDGRPDQAHRLAGLPGRELFPLRRPGRSIWRLRPRHRHQHRRPRRRRNFPASRQFWLEANGPAIGIYAPAGRALHHRRLPVRRREERDRRGGDECALRCCSSAPTSRGWASRR